MYLCRIGTELLVPFVVITSTDVFLNTVKTVFKGHCNIPKNVSIHDSCPFITGSLT